MKKIFKISSILAMCLMVGATALTTGCSDSDEFNTEQFSGGVSLNSFGPCPVARGGELRFIGSGLKQVNKVEIPGAEAITDINVVSDNEIRVTVPQTAEVGLVKLHYPGGVITTITEITYSEPISIESIAPANVRPGDEITINGDYLNLMHQVVFSFIEGGDSANVAEADFIEHSRAKIVVVVPENAISGVVAVSDGAEIPNVIKSEDEIVVALPEVDATLDLTDTKGGSQVTIKGKNLDLVKTVQTPAGDDLEFDYDAEKGEITFTLPDNITDGSIVVIPASGVKVAVANIGVVVPTELKATPAEKLRGGDIVKISGLNIDQVVSLVFPNVADAVAPSAISATELSVEFPAMAQSGDVVINLKSGKTVAVALDTDKPSELGFANNSVPAAGSVTIEGKSIDLVVKVAFASGEEVEVAPESTTQVTLIAPATASSGKLTLTMANGESVTTPELTINAPECAYIVELVTTELAAGDLFIAAIANADVLTEVQVNGSPVQYIVNNNQLYISLPSSCGKNTEVKLVSSNGEIAYVYEVIPATHVEIIAYDGGPRDLGSWTGEADGGAFRIYKDVFESVPAGASLVFHIAPYAFAQIQVNDANWSQMDILQPAQTESTAVFELTADRLDQILNTNDGWSQTGIVVQGEGCIVSKVTIEYEQSLEETIWTGPWACVGWVGNQDLAWGGFDWSSVKAGQILRFYLTPDVPEGTWWCIDLRHGMNWEPLVDGGGQHNTPASPLEIVITQAMINDLLDNGGLVITGQDYTLEKITIE